MPLTFIHEYLVLLSIALDISVITALSLNKPKLPSKNTTTRLTLTKLGTTVL